MSINPLTGKALCLLTLIGTSILIPFNCIADDAKLEAIFQDINRAPSWGHMNAEKDGPKLMLAIEETRYLSVDEYKQIIMRLLPVGKEKPMDGAELFHNWCKIYVLNRFFFNVPRSLPAGEKLTRFGGFQIDYKKEGPLYPLREEADGRFFISESYRGGYMGAGYQALAEADYFYTKYGLRYPAK